MIDYNIVYVAVWGLAILSLLVRSAWGSYIFFGQVAILSLFVALKFETGYDWPVYESHFLQVSAGGVYNLDFEIGYELLVRFFSWLGFGFHQFVAVLNIVEIFLISISVRYFFPKYCIFLMAIVFAIPDFYLIPSFSLVRQGLAVSLFFYGVRCYVGHKRLLSYVMFGLAVSFHYSVLGALVFLVLGFKVKLSKNIFAVLFLVSGALYVLSIDIARFIFESMILYFNPKYMIYLERDVYNASMLYRVVYLLVSLIVCALIYIAWHKKLLAREGSEQEGSSIYRLAMLGILIPLVIYGFPTFSTRYQYFFCIFTIGVCLTVLNLFNARDRFLILMITCVVTYIPFYRFLTNPLSIVYIPYQSQFFYDKKNSTGQQRTDDLLNQLDILWSK